MGGVAAKGPRSTVGDFELKSSTASTSFLSILVCACLVPPGLLNKVPSLHRVSMPLSTKSYTQSPPQVWLKGGQRKGLKKKKPSLLGKVSS